MKILGIESSCDDTSAAVVEETAAGLAVLSNIVSSQIGIHRLYGGVVPEIAGRAHAENISGAVYGALEAAGTGPDELSAVAVTTHPGLIGALLVGVNFAKAFAFAHSLPLIPVNHIHAHTAAAYLLPEPPVPPFLSLVVSGGHTSFYAVDSYVSYREIGGTRDDAAGEAFDKVARAIGLGYPGGPKIDKAAKDGNPNAYDFPKAKIADNPFDFSFSGVKSAVLNELNARTMKGEEIVTEDVAASFQKSVVETLVERAMLAAEETGVKKIALAGGVASNTALRKLFKEECEKRGLDFYYPSPELCTDNAVMIGSAAYFEYINGTRHGWDLNAIPNLKLGEK